MKKDAFLADWASVDGMLNTVMVSDAGEVNEKMHVCICIDEVIEVAYEYI